MTLFFFSFGKKLTKVFKQFFSCIWVIQDKKFKERLHGNDPGAPKNPKIAKKFILTTFITTVLFIGIYYMVRNDYLNLREYLQ